MKIKKILRLSAEDSGGRNRTRTCDPIDVNDVLYPCGQINQRSGLWKSRTGFRLKGKNPSLNAHKTAECWLDRKNYFKLLARKNGNFSYVSVRGYPAQLGQRY